MLPPLTMQVSSNDGESWDVIETTPQDYVDYEQKFKQSALVGWSEGLWSFYMFVLWNAMSREKRTELTWPEWLAAQPVFKRDVKVEEPAPLDRTPPDGGSLN